MRKIILIAVVLTTVFIGVSKELSETEKIQLKENWNRANVNENDIVFSREIHKKNGVKIDTIIIFESIPLVSDIKEIKTSFLSDGSDKYITCDTLFEKRLDIDTELRNKLFVGLSQGLKTDSTNKKDKEGKPITVKPIETKKIEVKK